MIYLELEFTPDLLLLRTSMERLTMVWSLEVPSMRAAMRLITETEPATVETRDPRGPPTQDDFELPRKQTAVCPRTRGSDPPTTTHVAPSPGIRQQSVAYPESRVWPWIRALPKCTRDPHVLHLGLYTGSRTQSPGGNVRVPRTQITLTSY